MHAKDKILKTEIDHKSIITWSHWDNKTYNEIGLFLQIEIYLLWGHD